MLNCREHESGLVRTVAAGGPEFALAPKLISQFLLHLFLQYLNLCKEREMCDKATRRLLRSDDKPTVQFRNQPPHQTVVKCAHIPNYVRLDRHDKCASPILELAQSWTKPIPFIARCHVPIS